jgi:uncharacterized membrane protein YhaH (DUF805 family)
VIWSVILVVVSLLAGLTADPTSGDLASGGVVAPTALLFIHLIASVSYGIRRLHDFDKSGWWHLLLFVPFANLAMALIMLQAPGSPGGNRYGVRA